MNVTIPTQKNRADVQTSGGWTDNNYIPQAAFLRRNYPDQVQRVPAVQLMNLLQQTDLSSDKLPQGLVGDTLLQRSGNVNLYHYAQNPIPAVIPGDGSADAAFSAVPALRGYISEWWPGPRDPA